MNATGLALGVATGSYMGSIGGSDRRRSSSGGWGSPARDRSIMNRIMDSSLGSLAVIAAGTTAAVVVPAIGMATLAANLDAKAGAAMVPIHVAVLDADTVRSDYGYPNVTIDAMRTDPSRNAPVAKDSEPSRGAIAVESLLDEMRLSTRAPIVVHAFDPFVKGSDGRSRLDVEGVRKVAPVMAQHGVKVAMAPFDAGDAKAAAEIGRIMKANGIAVFSSTADRGGPMIPGSITVRATADLENGRVPGNLTVQGDRHGVVGRAAATGALYATMNPRLKGAAAIGFEIQDRIDKGTQIEERRGAKIRTIRSMRAEPDRRLPDPSVTVRVSTKGPAQVDHVAAAATRSASNGR